MLSQGNKICLWLGKYVQLDTVNTHNMEHNNKVYVNAMFRAHSVETHKNKQTNKQNNCNVNCLLSFYLMTSNQREVSLLLAKCVLRYFKTTGQSTGQNLSVSRLFHSQVFPG